MTISKMLLCAMAFTGSVSLYQQLPARPPHSTQSDLLGGIACRQLAHPEQARYGHIPFAVNTAQSVFDLIGC